MKSKVLTIVIDLLVLAACVVLAYFLSNWLFYKIKISGPSMESTIHDKDTVILYKQGNYKRGDIIVFKTNGIGNDTTGKYYIKRIIAVAGDTVEIKAHTDGTYRIFVNDEALEEDYLAEGIPCARECDVAEKIVIPEGQFYFCGDNRLNSNDSRAGLLGENDAIVGRVIVRYAQKGKNLEFIKRHSRVELLPAFALA